MAVEDIRRAGLGPSRIAEIREEIALTRKRKIQLAEMKRISEARQKRTKAFLKARGESRKIAVSAVKKTKKALRGKFKKSFVGRLRRIGLRQKSIKKFRKTTGYSADSNMNPGAVVSRHNIQKGLELQESNIRNQKLTLNTKNMLDRLRRIQNKSRTDDLAQQRRQREKRILADAGSILKTPNIFLRHQVDFTGVKENNILKAESVFKENPEDNILRSRGRNILDTKENTLRF